MLHQGYTYKVVKIGDQWWMAEKDICFLYNKKHTRTLPNGSIFFRSLPHDPRANEEKRNSHAYQMG